MVGQSLQVLVVDADERRLERVGKFLSEHYFYVVQMASDAQEAWRLVTSPGASFHVALIDDALPALGAEPGSSSFDLTGRIKALSPQTGIVIYTDRKMPDVEEALRAGAFSYLTKPFNLMDVDVAVRHAAEYQQLKRAENEKKAFEVLLETSSALLSGHTQTNAFDLILKGVRAVGFDRVRLYLLSEDGAHLVRKAHAGLNGDGAVAEKLLADGAAVRDLLADPRPRLFRSAAGSPGSAGGLPAGLSGADFSCVALRQNGRGVGLIVADNLNSGLPITDEMLRPLSLFAAQAAATIENKFILEAERKARNLQAVLRVSAAVNSSLDLDQTLQSACRAAVELIGVDHSGMVLFSTDMESGVVRAEYPNRGAIHQTIQVQGVKAEERLVNRREPLLVEDVEQATDLGAVRDLLLKMDVRSIFVVPVIRHDKVVGSFSFDSIGRPRAFTDDEIELCKIFASQVAVAIDNARLFEETDKQKKHFKRLVESTPNGMLELDMSGRIVAVNERATQMLGYAEAELIGRPSRELYRDPDEHLRVCEQLQSSADHRINKYMTSAVGRDGEEIPVSVSATWLHNDNDRVGSIVFFEDLRSIREAERETAVLLEASNIITRPESLETGLESLAEMLVSLLRKTFCQILLSDESGLFLVVRAAALQHTLRYSLRWEPGVGHRIPKSDWPEGLDEFLREGGPAVITPDHADENTRLSLRNFSARLQLESGVKSLLLVPLRMGDLVVGLLCVGEVREERAEFTPEAIARASAIAAQTTALIELRRQFQVAERRKRLLAQLDAALLQIGDEQDTVKLLQEIARLAAQLFDCEVALLVFNRERLKEVEIAATYGLPPRLKGMTLPHASGVLGEVASTGKSRIVYEYNHRPDRDPILRPFELRTLAAVPLKQAGQVEAVLCIAGLTDRPQLDQNDLEILERFAARATVAIRTSRLISSEQRVFDRLTILQKISEYLLKEQPGAALEKILHVVLTGVTAGYGLGFNRAVLMLREEVGGDLVGRMGIGQLEERAARAAWDSDHAQGLYDFAEYIGRLERGEVPTTAVGEIVGRLRLPVNRPAADPLSRAVVEREWQLINPENLDQLPRAFRDAMNPSTQVIAVPLIARDNVLGTLVVDNKFTEAPITHSDIESLLAFANTLAIALDNSMLFHETERARLNLSSLYKTSNELISRADHKQVLEDIVQRTWVASGGMSVRLILIDGAGRARKLHTAGDTGDIPLADAVRPDGVAAEVMRTGQPFIVSDKRTMAGRLNPLWMRDRAEASLCLPLSLQEKRIGVMWINYERARHFTEFEVNALKLYANQAAIAYDSARRMEELEHMRRAADAMAAAAAPRDVLAQIVRSARDVLQADSAAIWSYDDVRRVFIKESSAVDGIPSDYWEGFWKKEPREQGTARTVMAERYVVVENCADTARYPFLGDATRRRLARIGVESFQGIALTVGDEILGVLYVNYKRQRSLSEEEQETARTFANQAALALKKARLLDQVNRARDAALVVANVTALEKDLQSTLKAITEGTSAVLRCDAVMLYTYDAEHRAFGFPPTLEGVNDPGGVQRLCEVEEHSVVHKVLALDHPHVAHDSVRDPVMTGPFVHREGIKSSVGIPLVARGRKVGVMFINYRRRHRFSDDELRNIELFAKQAAVAIRNGQLYEQLRRRVTFLQSLSKASSAITKSLDMNEILRGIAYQTCRVASVQGQQVSFVEIKLIDGMKARPAAAYPYDEFAKMVEEFGEEIDLEKGRDGKIGILGRAVRDESDKIVNDVMSDPDYIGIHNETRSQMVLLLKSDQRIIGAISVEHPERNAFDAALVKALKSLAAQAAVAIQNARRFKELKSIKGYVGNYTALRWMKMVSTSWAHNIRRGVGTARGLVTLVEQELPAGDGESGKVIETLGKLDAIIEGIGEVTIPAPLSSEDESVDHVQVNHLVRAYLTRLWAHDGYRDIQLELDLQPDLDDLATVWASRAWLRQAFEIFVENAVRAMNRADGVVKRLTFKTRLKDDTISIEITDTGPGIPPPVLSKFGRLPIDKEEGGCGAGIGVVLAYTIVDTYGGKINVRSGSSGVSIRIDLPAV